MSRPEQYMPALAKANKIRLGRAAIKRQLHAAVNSIESRRLVAALVDDPPAVLDGMRLVELLRAGRSIGWPAINRCLRIARISETKKIGELTERQRTRVAATLLAQAEIAAKHRAKKVLA